MFEPDIISYFSSIALFVIWLIAMFKPKWMGRSNLGAKNNITKRSDWMRGRASHFANQMVRYSALPLALVAFLYADSFGKHLMAVYAGLGSGITYLFSRRLKRQWDLWQQLGYDGPPALDQQQKQLTQPPA
jgi:hypothetical protein